MRACIAALAAWLFAGATLAEGNYEPLKKFLSSTNVAFSGLMKESRSRLGVKWHRFRFNGQDLFAITGPTRASVEQTEQDASWTAASGIDRGHTWIASKPEGVTTFWSVPRDEPDRLNLSLVPSSMGDVLDLVHLRVGILSVILFDGSRDPLPSSFAQEMGPEKPDLIVQMKSSGVVDVVTATLKPDPSGTVKQIVRTLYYTSNENGQGRYTKMQPSFIDLEYGGRASEPWFPSKCGITVRQSKGEQKGQLVRVLECEFVEFDCSPQAVAGKSFGYAPLKLKPDRIYTVIAGEPYRSDRGGDWVHLEDESKKLKRSLGPVF